MGEWRDCILGNFVTLSYGKGLPQSKREAGDVPVYSSAGLTGWHNKSLVETKGLIVGRKGTIGKIYKSNGPFFTIDTAYYITPDDAKCDFDFLYYLLISMRLDKLNEDSAVPGLNRETAYSQEARVPQGSDEQKAIAGVLLNLDDKIDLLQQQNKTLEAMAEALFRHTFIDNAQDDWVDGVLGDIVDFNPRLSLKKGVTAPYVEMSALSTNSFNPSGWYDRAFNSGMRFQNNDTLFARITPCLENGKTGFVAFLKEDEIGWGSTEYIVMRMKDGFHPFLSYVIARYGEFRDYAKTHMSGSSGRQRVQAGDLKDYKILRPPKEGVNELNSQLDPIASKLKLNAEQIQTLEKLRDTLLPKLMSGDLRVQYDEAG